MGMSPPLNEWAKYPACGYISLQCSRHFSDTDKDISTALRDMYRLQPVEIEAYQYQYENAQKLYQFVSANSSFLINPEFVKNKLSFEIAGFESLLEESKIIFNTDNPRLEANKALWAMFNADFPKNTAQTIFQCGAMMTEDILCQSGNINNICKMTIEHIDLLSYQMVNSSSKQTDAEKVLNADLDSSKSKEGLRDKSFCFNNDYDIEK